MNLWRCRQNKGAEVMEVSHGRSASYDPYNGVRKPRSRTAVAELPPSLANAGSPSVPPSVPPSTLFAPP